MKTRIGIDVGGTGLRGGVVDEDGMVKTILRRKLPTREVETVCDALVDMVNELGGSDAVGIGMPGYIRDGVVLASPNFPDWNNVDLRSKLRDRMSCDVVVENDANAAALGCWVMRGKVEDLLMITLGTGIGGGFVSDSTLFRGSSGTGMELGHMIIGGDRRCSCGSEGCFETWASNRGFVQGAEERGKLVEDATEVIEAAKSGEGWAQEVCAEVAMGLGTGLVNIINLFNPETIVITGGLTAARELIAPLAHVVVKKNSVQPSMDACRIVWAGRADEWAIIGAAQSALAA